MPRLRGTMGVALLWVTVSGCFHSPSGASSSAASTGLPFTVGSTSGSTSSGGSGHSSNTSAAGSSGSSAVASTSSGLTSEATVTASGSTTGPSSTSTSTSGSSGTTVGPTGSTSSSSGATGGPPQISCADAGAGSACAGPDGGLGACCAGACVVGTLNGNDDPNNCGGCGIQCPSSSTCTYGYCNEACGPGVSCPTGFECSQGACLASACDESTEGSLCALGSGSAGRCCGGTCEAVFSPGSGDSCFACGYSCPSGTFCNGEGCSPSITCSAQTLGQSCEVGGEVGFCCAEGCVTDSEANCGGCGLACPTGQVCSLADLEYVECSYVDGGPGSCTGAQGNSLCPPDDTCEYDSYCVATTCTASNTGSLCSLFSPSSYCCNSGCVDIADDPNNCGGCGVVCATGTTCTNGACTACGANDVGSSCATATGSGTCCDGYCADTYSDSSNCGGCGIACTAGETCYGYCYSGFETSCSGVSCSPGDTCVLNATDESTSCVPTTCHDSPDSYPCALSGTAVGACCTDSCRNLADDSQNCGGCGNPCAPGQFCLNDYCYLAPVCSSSTPGTSCPVDGGGDGFCCGSGCVDETSDPLNCGACGSVCPAGSECSQSRCAYLDGGLASCEASGCAPGLGCVDATGSCLPTSCAEDAQACAAGGVAGSCCSGTCVTAFTTDTNCGYCGNACLGDTFCNGYYCIDVPVCAENTMGDSCPMNDGGIGSCCTNGCEDTSSDPDNCGGCGVFCPVGSACEESSCYSDAGFFVYCDSFSSATCPAGTACSEFDRCYTTTCTVDGNPCAADGGFQGNCCGSSCLDLSEDDANCGLCGNGCDAGQFCTQGSCAPVPTCSPSTEGTSCPLDAGGDGTCCPGGCANFGSDDANCGGCGQLCPLGSHCGTYGCTTDAGYYASCSGSGLDGGCASGYSCLGDICVLGSCGGNSDGEDCPLPTADYPNLEGICCDGTCINPQQNTSNCGRCGTQCQAGEVCTYFGCDATEACSGQTNGYCSLGANATGECCGGGCVDEQTDVHNCGFCGTDCTTYGFAQPACCDNDCIDLSSNYYDCGTCGHQCSEFGSCSAGSCN